MLVAQLCPTLCDPVDCSSLLGSSVQGILQAKILEWVDIPSSTQGDLPNLGIEPRSPALQADSFPLSHQGSPRLQYLGVLVINLWFCDYTKISVWLPEMVEAEILGFLLKFVQQFSGVYVLLLFFRNQINLLEVFKLVRLMCIH